MESLGKCLAENFLSFRREQMMLTVFIFRTSIFLHFFVLQIMEHLLCDNAGDTATNGWKRFTAS